MHRSVIRLALSLIFALTLGSAAALTATAQGTTVAPHPSHIHEGTCDNLNPQPAYPLNDVAPVSADAPAGSVEVAHSTVDVSLDELLASPHALNTHESAENVSVYIACGDITGPVVDGLLLIPLRQQNDSGYYGIAALASNDAGGTDVSVYIAPEATGGAAATPAAETSTESEASTAAGAADTATAEGVSITIADFAFSPQTIEIPVGTTVTWTNNDVTQHTATAKDGTWDSGILGQGDTFSFTFDTAGTYDYICSLHPNMTGQIVVTG